MEMHKVTIHRDTTVYVRNDGVFTTDASETDLGELTADTLDALKKKIDEAGKKKMPKASALLLTNKWGDSAPEIEEVTVTSIVKERWGGPQCWLLHKPGSGARGRRAKHRANAVYKDTQKNRELAARWVEQQRIALGAQREAERIEQRMETFEKEVQ